MKGSWGGEWFKRWSFRRLIWQEHIGYLRGEKWKARSSTKRTLLSSKWQTKDSFGDRRKCKWKGRFRKHWRQTPEGPEERERGLVFIEDTLHATQNTKYIGWTHVFFCLCSFLFFDHEININNGFYQSQCVLVWTIHYPILSVYTFPLCFLNTIFQFTPEEVEHLRGHLMAHGQ